MPQAAFVRGSSNRRPEFQLLTLIITSGKKLQVHKRIAHPKAKAHLDSFIKKQTLLADSGINCRVSKASSQPGGDIEFEFIDGVSLESKFAQALSAGDISSAIKQLERALTVVDSLPSKTMCPTDHDAFSKVFGNYYNEKISCVTPACIDLNLDNLVEKDGTITLIDYEWVFDFYVPRDFIKLRLVHHAFLESKSRLLKLNPDGRFVFFGENLFVPEEFYKTHKPVFQTVDGYLRSNQSFINYVQLSATKNPIEKQAPRTMLARELIELISPFSAEQPRITKELDALRNRVRELSLANEAQNIALTSQEKRIQELQATLTYKLVQRGEIRLRQQLKRPRDPR